MDPAKSEKSKEQKKVTKGYEDQYVHIQGTQQNIIKIATVTQKGLDDSNVHFGTMIAAAIQKGMDDSNARFYKMFKVMTIHQEGTSRMLNHFERSTKMESDNHGQDVKQTLLHFSLDQLQLSKMLLTTTLLRPRLLVNLRECNLRLTLCTVSNKIRILPVQQNVFSPSSQSTNPCLRRLNGNQKWRPT